MRPLESSLLYPLYNVKESRGEITPFPEIFSVLLIELRPKYHVRSYMINYTTTEEHNPAQKSKVGKAVLVLPQPDLPVPQSDPQRQRSARLLKATCDCIPSKADSTWLKGKKKQQGFMAFAGGLFGFLIGFCCLGGVFWFCFFKIQTRMNFTKQLALLINLLKLIPIQDTSCL